MRTTFLVEKHDGFYLAINHTLDNFSPSSLNYTILYIIIQFPLIILVSENWHIVISEKTDQSTQLVHRFFSIWRYYVIEIINCKEIWDWKIKLQEIQLENVSLLRVPSQIKRYYSRWLAFKPHYCFSVFLIAWTANWYCRYLYCDYKSTKNNLLKHLGLSW